MLQQFRTEEIYDAATDDEVFDQLALTLAKAIDARSGVIHWKDFERETEEVSYSGYFSGDQMALYERHFAEADLWSVAVGKPERVNRVWDCEQLVPSAEFENGLLYNEWIRAMGDDSYRALGAALQTETAVGEIGFHRGKDQPVFGADAVRIVEEGLSHIRRMVTIRSKLIADRRTRDSVSASLDILGDAIFTLDTCSRLLHCNLAGEAILRRGDALVLRQGRLGARDAHSQRSLEVAIARAVAPEASEASGLLLHRGDGRPYEISILSSRTAGVRRVFLVLTDPEARNIDVAARLRDLYGLTAAEAEVSARLAEGASPALLAEERGVTVGTVHSQLKAIFSKVGCRRQSELVGIVNNLPRLHKG